MIGSIAAAPVATALELAHDVDGLSEYDRLHIYNSTDPSLRIVMQADSRACPHDTWPDATSFVYKSISRRKQRWKPHGWSLIHEITSDDCTSISRKLLFQVKACKTGHLALKVV